MNPLTLVDSLMNIPLVDGNAEFSFRSCEHKNCVLHQSSASTKISSHASPLIILRAGRILHREQSQNCARRLRARTFTDLNANACVV